VIIQQLLLIIPNLFYLLFLKSVNFFKLILFRYNSGVVKTVWNLTFREPELRFTCKTVDTHFGYCISDVSVLPTDCIKDLGVILVNCISFSCYILPQGLRA
jgi:hypothetical protein